MTATDPPSALSVYDRMKAEGCSDRIDLGVVIAVLDASDALLAERTDSPVLFEGTVRDLMRATAALYLDAGHEPWNRRVRVVAVDHQAITGNCEDDCQTHCAYPGQFSECDLGAKAATDG